MVLGSCWSTGHHSLILQEELRSVSRFLHRRDRMEGQMLTFLFSPGRVFHSSPLHQHIESLLVFSEV